MRTPESSAEKLKGFFLTVVRKSFDQLGVGVLGQVDRAIPPERRGLVHPFDVLTLDVDLNAGTDDGSALLILDDAEIERSVLSDAIRVGEEGGSVG